MEPIIATEGLSPMESSDSENDLFSNVALKLNSTSAVTNYDFNSAGFLETKRQHVISKMSTWFHNLSHLDRESQDRKSVEKTHRFRFWLNEKDNESPIEGWGLKTPEYNDTLNTQASIYNHQFSRWLFSDANTQKDDDDDADDDDDDDDETFSSQAALYEFDALEFEYSDVLSAGINYSSQALTHQFDNIITEKSPILTRNEIFHASETYTAADEIYYSGATDSKLFSSNNNSKNPCSSKMVRIYGFDDKEPSAEISQEDKGFSKDIEEALGTQKNFGPWNRTSKVHDDKYYLESLQDILVLDGGIRDFFSIPLDRQSPTPKIRLENSRGADFESDFESFSESLTSPEPLIEKEFDHSRIYDTDIQSNLIKRRFRLKTLIHYLKNKFSYIRDCSEVQLLNIFWDSTLMKRNSTYSYCRKR